MSQAPHAQRFLLLPPRGTQTSVAPAGAHLGALMASFRPLAAPPVKMGKGKMKVLDSVHENGIKLVELTPAGVAQLRQEAPGLRIVPEVFYETAEAPRPTLAARARTLAGATPAAATLRFEANGSGLPVRGATVIAFTDFAQGIGAQGRTRVDGSIKLAIGANALIERLYVYPHDSCWPLVRKNLQLPQAAAVRLRPIDFAEPDVLQLFRAKLPGHAGQGVKVGIVDTGCGPHPDLLIAGGMNTVFGENPTAYEDNGDQHGTHVAGIVAARGAAPAGMRGLAPQVALYAYRVFAKGQGASNFAITKAIDQAVADGCDVINMSLGGGPSDPATSSAIADARAAGVVVLCASGNDGADAVSYPGADARAVAVGAFGRKGSFPKDSVSATNLGKPLGKPDKANFMASFSNHGPEIDMAGPGVGVVSTVPAALWAVMDGTSMACPAVVGALARLLSAKPSLLNLPRDQARSDAILTMAFKAARAMGFGPQYEGNGWIMK